MPMTSQPMIGGGNDSHRQSREDVARGVGKGKRVHRVPHCLGRNGRFQRRVVTPPLPSTGVGGERSQSAAHTPSDQWQRHMEGTAARGQRWDEGGGCQPLQGIRLRGELIPWARGPRISMVRPCSRSLLCERPARRGEEGGKFAKAPTDAWPEVARNRWKKEITGNKEKGRRELRGDVLVALRGRQKRPKGAGTGPRNPPPLSPHRVAQGATQRLSEEGV